MTDQSDHVVLPRAAVEALLERLDDEIWRSTPDEQNGINYARREIDDLLAVAKPVVDAGACNGAYPTRRDTVIYAASVVDSGPDKMRHGYRVLLIAADAAEEG